MASYAADKRVDTQEEEDKEEHKEEAGWGHREAKTAVGRLSSRRQHPIRVPSRAVRSRPVPSGPVRSGLGPGRGPQLLVCTSTGHPSTELICR